MRSVPNLVINSWAIVSESGKSRVWGLMGSDGSFSTIIITASSFLTELETSGFRLIDGISRQRSCMNRLMNALFFNQWHYSFN